MRFEEKEVTLRDGRALILRSPGEGDAEGMLAYLRQTAGETHFLLRTPEEVTMTLEEEKAFLKSCAEDSRRMMMAAFADGKPVGSISFAPAGPRKKVCHRAEMGVAVLREYWGQGLGTLLMREALDRARAMGYEQMELAVYEDNSRAIRLYERFGFKHWGRVRRAFRLEDGSYRDDLLMGMFLKEAEDAEGSRP